MDGTGGRCLLVGAPRRLAPSRTGSPQRIALALKILHHVCLELGARELADRDCCRVFCLIWVARDASSRALRTLAVREHLGSEACTIVLPRADGIALGELNVGQLRGQ